VCVWLDQECQSSISKLPQKNRHRQLSTKSYSKLFLYGLTFVLAFLLGIDKNAVIFFIKKNHSLLWKKMKIYIYTNTIQPLK
jgi:hypothetical protein